MLLHNSNAKANTETKSCAEMLRDLFIAEHRVCAREHKLRKSMKPDGRCGWYMAAELLFGTPSRWADAKKLLVCAASSDSKLFLELRTMNVEERLDYFKALRSRGADEDQQFDLTMLRVLGWCIGMPVKVLSATPAYDGAVYANEFALALREAAGLVVPEAVCVVCACLSSRGQCLAALGRFSCLRRAASR